MTEASGSSRSLLCRATNHWASPFMGVSRGLLSDHGHAPHSAFSISLDQVLFYLEPNCGHRPHEPLPYFCPYPKQASRPQGLCICSSVLWTVASGTQVLQEALPHGPDPNLTLLCFAFPWSLIPSLRLHWREPLRTHSHWKTSTKGTHLGARHLLGTYYVPCTVLGSRHSGPSSRLCSRE